jgi:hypothetical protein
MSEIELTNRSLVALMAAILSLSDEGCTAEEAVDWAEKLVGQVERRDGNK